MRLFERERRADSRMVGAWQLKRTTQASNFSVLSRGDCCAVIGTTSIPNWRKHSESRTREGSCRSTSAARAENFLAEEVRGEREFPKRIFSRTCGSAVQRPEISNRKSLTDNSRPPNHSSPGMPILARELGHGKRAKGQLRVPKV